MFFLWLVFSALDGASLHNTGERRHFKWTTPKKKKKKKKFQRTKGSTAPVYFGAKGIFLQKKNISKRFIYSIININNGLLIRYLKNPPPLQYTK